MGENRRPITPEDLAAAPTLDDPQISPDGALVAFVVGEESRVGAHPRSALFLVAVEGDTPARRFTQGTSCDSAPRWSPDGGRLAFLSDRAEPGKAQPYCMAVDGGEAEMLAGVPGVVEDLQWSPDGTMLALRVREAEGEEEQRRARERDDAAEFGARWRNARIWLLHLADRSLAPLTVGERHAGAFAWAPDGARLALASQESSWEDSGYSPLRLDLHPVDGGQSFHLATLRGPSARVRWSPDGTLLALLGSEGHVHAGVALLTVPVAGGEARVTWPGYQGAVEWFDWAQDGRSLLVAAQEDLAGTVFRLPLDAEGRALPPAEPLLPEELRARGHHYDDLTFSADGRTLAMVRACADQPPEVWAGPPGRVRKRTAINAAAAAWALGRVEQLRWPAAGDLEISGLLVYPAAYEPRRRYPMVTLIHGGPDWYWGEYFPTGWAQLLSSNGYAVLLPNPRGGTGRGAAFNDAGFDDYGGAELDDSLRGVDAVIAMGVADPERLGIGGWSHGGYMTAWAVTQTTRFKAAVMGAGLANLLSDQGQNDIPRCNDDYYSRRAYDDPEAYIRRSPIIHVRRVVTPTLVLHGADDARVHPAQGREFYMALRLRGVGAAMVTYPREGHAIEERAHRIDLLRRVLAWYDRHLRLP